MPLLRLSLLLALGICVFAQDPLTPQQERGRQIYERGSSPSGQPINATLGEGNSVSAAILPCANCHGHDGEGKPEGGIVPSNITWDALTKPYGLTHPDGRTHPPYTERLLTRAITMGLDPAGNPLNPAMPRFQLSMADAAALVDYIKRLGQAADPGLAPDRVRLGVILPPSTGAPAGQIIRQAVEDYASHVNQAGGIFSRRIELSFMELPAGRAARGAAVRDFLSRENIFAIVCATLSGSEAEIAGVARESGTPMIATFAAFPPMPPPLNPYVFYLDGGLPDELEALVQASHLKTPPVLVSSEEAASQQAAAWLKARLGKSGYLESATLPTDGAVFWLRSDAPPTGSDRTLFLIPGAFAEAASLPNLQHRAGKLLVAISRTPSLDATRAIWDRSVASAEVMGEALKRTGRSLSRSTLTEALEGLYRVESSLHVPISFGPNRRTGANTVRLMTLDARGTLVPVTR